MDRRCGVDCGARRNPGERKKAGVSKKIFGRALGPMADLVLRNIW
jgi:hypothetical protein